MVLCTQFLTHSIQAQTLGTTSGDQVQRKIGPSGLPLPRFVSFRSGKVNMRAGRMPEPDDDGGVFLKVPVNRL